MWLQIPFPHIDLSCSVQNSKANQEDCCIPNASYCYPTAGLCFRSRLCSIVTKQILPRS